MQPNARESWMDWLRIFAILGVLLFHSAMPFVTDTDWHIRNKETSELLAEFNFWLSRFRMPLLFFISGAVSYFIMQRKSAAQFAGLRFRRLLVPLLFGMLIIVPPQVFMERLTQGYKGDFFSFYPSIFDFKPYPVGNTSWHHLWFILYLFIYDLLAAPFLAWTFTKKGKAFLQKISVLASGKWIYLLILPSVILYTFLSYRFPRTNNLIEDPFYLLYWFLFLMAGFLCISVPGLISSLLRNRRFSLGMAFVTILAINYFRWNNIEPWDLIADWQNDWRVFIFRSLYPLTSWFWVLALVGYGKKYLDRKHRILNYTNEAAYPFYILHQTIIVIIAYYVVSTRETIGSKFVFIVGLSFLVSVLIYHLFIRSNRILRLLFGMKPKAITRQVTCSPGPAKEEIKDGVRPDLANSLT